MRRNQSILGLVALALLALLLAACADEPGRNSTPIRVASKDFAEQFILGEMYALLLEDAGFKVERRLRLGETSAAHAALLKGEIDLYPEYTGTGLLTVLKLPTSGDPRQVYATVAGEYKRQFNLVWLDPAPMNNTQALAITREASERYGIKTISDLAAKASQVSMVGPPEFQQREDGLPGIMRVYGSFTLKHYLALDSALRYQALTSGNADVTVAYGTDGEIAAYNLILLRDDKGLFPPYQVAPVVRQELIDAHPGLPDVLNALAPKLTDETMQRLNYEVSGKQRSPADVAKEFLVQQQMLKEP